MSVSPDVLLKLNTDTGARLNTSRSTATNTSAADSARFAEVYAQQRQPQARPQQPQPAAAEREAPRPKAPERQEPAARAKPAERRDASTPSRAERTDDKAPAAEAKATGGDEKPAVADSGNELPEDDQAEVTEASLDPLLLFGLNTEVPPATEEVGLTEPSVETALAAGVTAVENAEGPTDEAPVDDLLAGLRQAFKFDQQPQGEGEDLSGEGEAKPTLENKATAETTDGFADMLLADAPVESEEPLAKLAEASLEEAFKPAEGGKETRSNGSTAEAAGLRLNGLAQAVGQAQQTQRAAQVLGQPVQMQQNGWSEEVVDRVMWLSSQNLKSAEIQLDPQELGRLEVRIEMNKDQTQVTFVSPHAAVREALESQSQRLRDMFTQQGMNLADVNVSDQSARGSQGQGGDGQSRGRGGFAGDAEQGDEQLLGVSEVAGNRGGGDRGLVDYYA